MFHSYPGDNHIFLRGRLTAAPQPSHQNHQQQFFRLPMEVRRLSGATDRLDLIAPQGVVEGAGELLPGQPLRVEGEVRTYNSKNPSGPRLVITVFPRVLVPDDAQEEDENRLTLRGHLCRPPSLRLTPLGRSICDLTLAVNRRYGRADYLPCIAWGSVAHRCAAMEVGDPLALEGRLQSREYTKVIQGESQTRTAMEVSIMGLEDPAAPL